MKRLILIFMTLLAIQCVHASTEIDGLYYDLNPFRPTAEVTFYSSSSTSNANYVTGDIIIPETIVYEGETYSVTSIGKDAFSGCSGLTSIEIPNSVTEIGGDAFEGCMSLTSVEIPNSVTSIGGYAFYGCSGLTSVEIPNSVTSIGSSAFSGCSGLTSVEIPNSFTKIDYGTFYKCTGLISIQIPNSVTIIGEDVFNGCNSLTSIEIPNSVTSIGKGAFNNCTSLKELRIEDGIATLNLGYNGGYYGNEHHGLFYDCPLEMVYWGRNLSYFYYEPFGNSYILPPFAGIKTLKQVTLGNSVTSVGDIAFNIAFRGCSGLTSINVDRENTSFASADGILYTKNFDTIIIYPGGLTGGFEIPNSVTEIGYNAFYGCTGLTSVIIPNSVTKIGDYAFYGCTGLTSVIIPNSVTTIYSSAFMDCTDLESVIIGNSVTEIGSSAFYGCSGLTSVTIPNCVTEIGKNAFSECIGLIKSAYPSTLANPFTYGVSVEYPAEGTFIENGIIWGKNKEILCFVPFNYEGSFAIPNSVTEIGDNAFSECGDLTSVTIPNSVTTIGNSAFSECGDLTSLTIPNSVTSVGNYVFKGCKSLKALRLEDGTKTLTLGFNADKTYENGYYGQGLFYDCPLETLYLGRNLSYNDDYYAGKSPFYEKITLKQLTISNSVTEIGKYAFSSCSNLTSVIIPYSITTIGNSAFEDCTGLTSVEIPNSVTEIGNYTFYGCTNLTSVIIPNSILSIGYSAFEDCSGLTSVDIPNSLTEIGSSVFKDCTGLSSVTIPNSITSIGYRAFYGCTGLQSITFNSRDVLSLGENAFYGCVNIEQILCNTQRPPVSETLNVFSQTTYSNAIVYVPEKDLYLYYTIIPWNKFSHIQSIGEFTELEINFDGSSSLSVGQSIPLTLSPKGMPNIILEASWRSSDTNVATVNQQGLVTAVAPGTAVITASDTYGHSATVTITVKEDDTPVEVPATGISITPTTPAELKVGESLQLTATVSPENATDKSVTWESSDSNVATVTDHGLVTAVAPGTAVITASDAYGHNAFVNITVIAAEDNGVETLVPEAETFYILTVDGILIKKNATQEDINTLAPGLYIIGGKKVIVK